jgi:hypothetical protein
MEIFSNSWIKDVVLTTRVFEFITLWLRLLMYCLICLRLKLYYMTDRPWVKKRKILSFFQDIFVFVLYSILVNHLCFTV